MVGVSRWLAAVSLSAVTAGCAVLPFGQPTGDLRSARLACNAQYPERVGSYLPHAQCVNAAIETYAMPTAPYPDLIRLQADLRAHFSEKIDRREITPQTAQRQMREADRLVTAAEHNRNAGKESAARRDVAGLEAMLR